MNIRPKIPMFEGGGTPSTVTWANPKSTWFTRSGDFGILEGTYNMLKPLYDKWKSSGTQEDYQAYKKAVDNLNTNQRYGYAPKHLQYLKGNNQLYKDTDVGAWQNYVRNNYSFINDAIGNNFSKYKIHSNNPYSGDNAGKEWKVDNLWAGITDDRTTWGNLLDPNDENYLKWKQKFSEIGIDYKTNPKWNTGDVLYGFLKDDTIDNGNLLEGKKITITPQKKINETPAQEYKQPESIWTKLGQNFKKVAPDLLDTLRLAGNMYNNDRVFKESMKAIKPNLQQSYHTYRQLNGDEATRQGFYRRAVQGEQRAARPITSDLDKQIAYQNEAKRIGDELRAQGDLADNQRIRETSQESMAHADANTERDTTVANSNLTELLKADAAKHQLTAQKYSADWTNLEQYLMGRQYKLEKEKTKQENIQDQIKTLQMQDDIANDPDIKNAYDALNNKAKQLFPNGNIDWNDTRLADDIKNLQSIRRKAMIKYYTLYAKEGTKITKKHKDTSDKFLYKTSKDIVEHFRKMSKMTDDSRIKTLPKPIKLTSHPRKMQLGGVAPFTVYRPLGVGGENAVSSQTTSSTDSKSSKDTAAKDKLDMIKELFKQVQGLPIDVSRVFQEISGVLNKAKAFGEELSTDDIASMYLNVMNRMSQLKYSQDSFNKAKAQATSNEALNEIAVGVNGEMVLQDVDTGKVKIGTISDWIKSDKKLNPLTNDQILELRAKSPNMVFNDDILGIVNNGVGMNKISAQIKSLAASIGSSTEKLEGISEVESRKIKNGLKILAGTDGTPDGFYKVSTDVKDSSASVNAALNYIYSMLPKNYKTLLEIHSDGKGKELIANFLNSQTNDYVKQDITPLTGQASSKKDGSGSGNDMLPSVAFFNGLGEKDQFIIQDKTSDGLKINTISTPITFKGYNTGSITFNKLESSDFGGQLLINQATMGDALISSVGRNNIIIDGRIYQAELPIDKEAKAQGIIKPDLKFLKKIEEADQKLKSMGIDKNDPSNIPTINKVYQECNLPILYTISGNKPTLTSDYARFAIVNGVGTEDAFGENPEFNDGIKEITGSKEREQFETLMKQQSGNAKYKLDNGIGFLGMSIGETKLYQGTIYIPMVTSNISALAGTGYRATGDEYNEIEARQQAADAARELGFNPAGDSSNLK